MPFNGSGQFTRTQNWAADAAAGIKIVTSRHDSEDDNFAAGLSSVICRDGQSQISADIPWNGKKITNLANPVNPQDAATKASSEAIRNFSTGITIGANGATLTGVSTGVAPNFVSTEVLGFVEPDMSIVGRKADATMVPPTLKRLAFNGTVGGAMASDLMYLDDAGKLVLLGTTNLYSQADAAYPVGTITERLVTSSETYAVPKGLKYLEVEGMGPGGRGGSSVSTGAATVSVGNAGGAGAHGWRIFTAAELSTNPTTPTVAITVAGISAGGTSIFAAAVGSATVQGGQPGANGTAGSAVAAQGAVGGVAAGWTINGTGQDGQVSWAGYLSSGQAQIRGPGGSTAYGNGGGGTFTSGTSAGTSGTGYGAGGGGGGCGFSGASQNGGNGAPAFFRLREYF